jgi:hypothetical protein
MGQVHVQGKNISLPRPPPWAPRRCTPVRCVLQGKGHRQVTARDCRAPALRRPRCLLCGLLAAHSACELVLSRAPHGARTGACRWTTPARECASPSSIRCWARPVVRPLRFTARRAHWWKSASTGQGYGLPHTAGPGERCSARPAGWRLLTDRACTRWWCARCPQQHAHALHLGERRDLAAGRLQQPAIEFAAPPLPRPARPRHDPRPDPEPPPPRTRSTA